MKVLNKDFEIDGVKTPLVCDIDGIVYVVVHNSVHEINGSVNGGVNNLSIGDKVADIVSAKGGRDGIINITVKFL